MDDQKQQDRDKNKDAQHGEPVQLDKEQQGGKQGGEQQGGQQQGGQQMPNREQQQGGKPQQPAEKR